MYEIVILITDTNRLQHHISTNLSCFAYIWNRNRNEKTRTPHIYTCDCSAPWTCQRHATACHRKRPRAEEGFWTGGDVLKTPSSGRSPGATRPYTHLSTWTPSSVFCRIMFLSRSPVDMCIMSNERTMRSDTVPFPEPGAPMISARSLLVAAMVQRTGRNVDGSGRAALADDSSKEKEIERRIPDVQLSARESNRLLIAGDARDVMPADVCTCLHRSRTLQRSHFSTRKRATTLRNVISNARVIARLIVRVCPPVGHSSSKNVTSTKQLRSAVPAGSTGRSGRVYDTILNVTTKTNDSLIVEVYS